MQIRTTLLTLVIFSSCITSKKIDKWVDKHYAETAVPARKSPDYLTVTTNLSTADKKSSTTKKTTNKMLPLFFYWQWHWAYTCTLNPNIPVENFTNTVTTYGNSKGLKRKLNGQQLELSIDQLPNVFAMEDKGYMVFVVLAYFGVETLTLEPAKTDMIVSYKIKQDGSETKTGTITIPDANRVLEIRMFNSTKKKTWEYIDKYNENIAGMTKKVVDELLGKL